MVAACLFHHSAWANPTQLTISIHGIEGALLKNSKKRLQSRASNLSKHMSAKQIQLFITAAPSIIEASTAPLGYFEPTVTHDLNQSDPAHWFISFHVNRGQPVIVQRVHIQLTGPGANMRAFKRAIKHAAIKRGQVFNASAYESTKSQLFDMASQFGFFKAKMVKSQVTIRPARHRATIKIHFDTGPRYAFGQSFFHYSSLSPDFLRRYLNYQPGEPYNNNKIQRTQNDLYNSGYFSQVVSQSQYKKTQHKQVPIVFQLSPAPKKQYTIGGGYGTDTSVRGTASIELRQVTRSGQHMKIQTQGSKIGYYVDARYFIPGRHPATQLYTIHALNGKEIIKGYGQSHVNQLGISYQTKLSKLTQIIDLTGLKENYAVTAFPETSTIALIPSIKWQYRYKRPRTIPKKGYSFALELSGAPLVIHDHDRFFQPRAGFKGLYTLPTHTRFVTRANVIFTKIKTLSQLPLSLHPMAGGSQSIRGYAYKSIHPSDGKNLFVGSVELQQKIWDELYLAGFYDAGTVGRNLSGKYYTSAGPGLVYLTRIGSIELDFAKPLIPHSRYHIIFGIGSPI